MKGIPLNRQDKELIRIAKEVIKDNYYRGKLIENSVGSALISESGKIYKGINIESQTSAPTSICAEMGAISEMVTYGDRKIKTIVAVHKKNKNSKPEIAKPCGACRHII